MQRDRWLGAMSDDVLSVIPADPHWQPEPSRAEQARDLIATLVPVDPDAADPEIRISWHQAITVIDCGAFPAGRNGDGREGRILLDQVSPVFARRRSPNWET